MANVVLITGGSRSGKSSYALQLGEGLPGPRAFIATCPPIDEEMAERIRKHRESRDPEVWETIEEPINLAGALQAGTGYKTVLVDCLTLWLSNMMYSGSDLQNEEDVSDRCRRLLEACHQRDGTVILVSNEVGMGIVPDNPVGRRFRDLMGRCNQIIASEADKVILMACGLPIYLKRENDEPDLPDHRADNSTRPELASQGEGAARSTHHAALGIGAADGPGNGPSRDDSLDDPAG